MAQSITFAPPAVPDQSDGGQVYVLGCQCETQGTAVAFTIDGVEWRCPNNAPTTATRALLYRNSDTSAPMAAKNFSPSLGVVNTVLFDAPVAGSHSEDYVVGVLTDRYAYTSPGGWPLSSTNIIAQSGVNGRLVFTTAGVNAYPNIVSGGATNFHISPIMTFGVAAANAALAIVLPKPLLAFASSAISAASLGITLPKPVLALNAAAIAGANLGIVLPTPVIRVTGGSLPQNLREYVWRLLSQDATMNALGINGASLYGTNAADSPAKDQQVWGILAWGTEEPPLGRDTTSRRRFLVFWAYCRDNDYSKIEPILHRARNLLHPLKGINHSPGGWITEVGDGTMGPDLYDPVYEASTKDLNLTIIASGN